MGREHIDLVRRGFETTASSRELPRELFQPDLIWDTTTYGPVGVNMRRCVGIDEADRWLAEWLEPFEEWTMEAEDHVDAGEQVVTILRQRGRTEHGPEVELRMALVWSFRDGLVSKAEFYSDLDTPSRPPGCADSRQRAR